MNVNHYDLYYTVIKNENEKEIVKDDHENMKMILLSLMILLHLTIIMEEKWKLR